MKKCKKCDNFKDNTLFYSNRGSKDGLYSVCKACKKVKNNSYKKENKEAEKIRNSEWYLDNIDAKKEYYSKYYPNNKFRYHLANIRRMRHIKLATIGDYKQEIDIIYKNRPKGHHVDHITPLQGKNVCGLHVPWNLQYLSAKDNLSKSNKTEE